MVLVYALRGFAGKLLRIPQQGSGLSYMSESTLKVLQRMDEAAVQVGVSELAVIAASPMYNSATDSVILDFNQGSAGEQAVGVNAESTTKGPSPSPQGSPTNSTSRARRRASVLDRSRVPGSKAPVSRAVARR